jgi:hypothetical protein
MVRMAVRRKVWKSLPGNPALRQADAQALSEVPDWLSSDMKNEAG